MTPRFSTNPPLSPAVRLAQAVDLLAPALGREKGEELIAGAAKDRGYSLDSLTLDRVLDIFGILGGHGGIVGVAARLAQSRMSSTRKKNSIPPPPVSRVNAVEKPREVASLGVARTSAAEKPREVPSAPANAAPAEGAKFDLVPLLTPTLGLEKAEEVVKSALEKLDLKEGALSYGEAVKVLGLTAKLPGLVGISSRFVLSRLLLQKGDPSASPPRQ